MKIRDVLVIGLLACARGRAAESTPVEAEARSLLATLVGFRTVAGQGIVPRMARYPADAFGRAAFALV